MARNQPTAIDKQRLARLDRVAAEIERREDELERLRGQRNKLVFQLGAARIMAMLALAKRAKISEPYAYRCLHDKGNPSTGGKS